MNQNMQAWLDALKTGQYEQAIEFLHKVEDGGKNTYCCLGVACDLAAKSGVSMDVHYDEYDEQFYYDEEGGVLPKPVQAWLGVDRGNPKIVINNPNYDDGLPPDERYFPEANRWQDVNPRYLVNDYVTVFNDDAGMTFEQIAELIEYAGFHKGL